MTVFARWDRVAAGLLGGAVFLWIIGTYALDPRHIDWMEGDNAQHFLGWAFFRHEAWRIPLGRITHFPLAGGTSLVFTDSLPLLGLPFRLIASWLPATFQYHGWWLLSCFVLQGVCAATLLEACDVRSPWTRTFGATLFVVAPWFNTHISLMGQWQLLLALALYAIDRRDRRMHGARWSALCVLTLFTHFYLWWMVATMAAAAAARDAWQQRNLRPFISHCAMILGASALTMALLGYFGGEDPTAGGYGLCSTNLNSFFNSDGGSRWIPGLPRGPFQYEGLAYFGVAGLLLVAAALVIYLRSHRRPEFAQWLPLWVALGYLYALALSTTVMWNLHHVLDLPRGGGAFFGTIRAAGRFVFIVADALLLFALVTVARRFPRAAAWCFAIAIVSQLYEMQPLETRRHIAAASELEKLHNPIWATIARDYDTLALYPPLLTPNRCIAPEQDGDRVRVGLARWAQLAAEQGLQINSAYLARNDRRALKKYCTAFIAAIDSGEVDPRTVYIVDAEYRDRFHARMPVDCGQLDGFEICTARSDRSALHAALVQAK